MKARLPSRLRRLFWKRERQQFKARIKEAVREYYQSIRATRHLPVRLYHKVSALREVFKLKPKQRRAV